MAELLQNLRMHRVPSIPDFSKGPTETLLADRFNRGRQPAADLCAGLAHFTPTKRRFVDSTVPERNITMTKTLPALRRPANRLFTSKRLALLATVGLMSACAGSGAPPVSEMATARASITQAESADAMNSAPVELLAARDKLGKAEAAVREEQYEQARRLAAQAEVQAEVAERKARAAKAQLAAAELARSNDLLSKELARKSAP